MKLEKVRARGCDGLYRVTDSKIIYFRQFRKGRGELKKSLRTTDIEEAKRKRDELRKNLNDKAERFKAAAKQAKTASELFEVWIQRKETMNRAPATLMSMRLSQSMFKPYFETMLPDEITSEWWETVYIREVRSKTHRTRKFFNDRKWLLGFLRQLLDDGLIDKLPKLLNPDSRESIGKVYSDEEVSNLLNYAEGEDLWLAIAMAATMGMRRSEIFKLRSDRIDIEKKLIRLNREDTKTRRARIFAISPTTLKIILSRAQSGSPWIFPSKDDIRRPIHIDGFTSAWRSLKERCGVKGRFHDLRHTFLTKAFNSPGANAAQICAYAGLSLQVAERVYLHLTEEDSRKVGELVKYE
jgi:integrase